MMVGVRGITGKERQVFLLFQVVLHTLDEEGIALTV